MQSARPRLIALSALVAGVLSLSPQAASQTYFEAPAERTGNNATVVIPSAAVDSAFALEPGDEIGVFNAEGRCVGASVWTGKSLAITIWGDNELTRAADGLKMDEPFSLQLWQQRTEAHVGAGDDRIDVELSSSRPYYRTEMRYAPNAIYVVETLRVEPRPDTDVTMR